MTQEILATTLVVIAAAFLFARFKKTFASKKAGCGTGCGCGTKRSISENSEKIVAGPTKKE